MHIADRDSKFYELYKECCELEAKFLIRTAYNRTINNIKRRRSLCKDKIFDYFRALTSEATITTKIHVHKDTQHRKAKLSMIFKKFTLPPPPNKTINKNGQQLYIVDLYGVIIIGKSSPENHEPLLE